MEDKIFSVTERDFEPLALEVFHFQYHSNQVYQRWVNTLGIRVDQVNSIEQIPFLPISFYKSHKVATGDFDPVAIFESSGTTGMVNSRHYVKSMDLYRKSFMRGFEYFYGNPEQYAILGLLPSYLERKNSSLVVMVDALIRKSRNALSGFYLYEHEELKRALLQLSDRHERIFWVGVTFALLDFSEHHPIQLKNAIVMETGGMKGRRDEVTREELHLILKKNLGVDSIHSEYGMTELLSQAYSKSDGIFRTPPWMKILVRDEEDPLHIKKPDSNKAVKGLLNIIDLANIYSCAFIATDDLGTLLPEGFTVDGRLDKSDLRGCSLLTF